MRLADERGSSTAELAVLLPSIAVMLSLVLALGSLGSQQIRVQQAASAVARELARGEQPSQARAAGTRLAGADAHFDIGVDGQLGTVQVAKSVQLPVLGPITVRGQAQAALESR